LALACDFGGSARNSLGFVTYFLLPNRPGEAKFLGTDEKEWIRAELGCEEQQKLEHRRYSVFQALASGRVWHLVLIYFGMLVGTYTPSSWVPQLVKSLSTGYSNTMVGFLVTIPNLVALVAMILVSRSSDRRLERRYHVAIPAVMVGDSESIQLSGRPRGQVTSTVRAARPCKGEKD
jgi:ACS family tartrate transporter-like MFS transporter